MRQQDQELNAGKHEAMRLAREELAEWHRVEQLKVIGWRKQKERE